MTDVIVSILKTPYDRGFVPKTKCVFCIYYIKSDRKVVLNENKNVPVLKSLSINLLKGKSELSQYRLLLNTKMVTYPFVNYVC